MARLRYWLRALRNRSGFEHEIDRELEFHLQARADQLQSTGVDHDEARRLARIELGMVHLHRDDMRSVAGLRLLDWFVADLRLAWRSLRRAPIYSTVAVFVLALPLATGLLLHGLYAAYAQHAPALDRVDRWIHLYGDTQERPELSRFSTDEADALVAQHPAALEGLYSSRILTLPIVTDRIRRGIGLGVSANYFDLTGVPALRGRVFGAQSGDRGDIVLSERGWTRLFNRDEQAIGQMVSIGGQPFRIIGVAGRDFRGTHEVSAHYWMLADDARRFGPAPDASVLDTEISGFIRPDAAVPALTQALSALVAELPERRNASERLQRVGVEAAQGYLRAADRRDLALAMTPAMLLVLLMMIIAAANLTNLVLARFSARRHDMALRAALGATPWRGFAQLLTECGLLGLAAATVALVLLAVALQPLHGLLFSFMADLGFDPIRIRLGPQSALLALVLALLATMVFGAVPAWLATRASTGNRSRRQLHQELKRVGSRRLHATLMVVQLAASVFLVVIAAMIGGVARHADDAPLGFDPERIVSIDAGSSGAQRAASLRQHPLVQDIAATSHIPLMGTPQHVSVTSGGQSDQWQLRLVDEHWFAVMGQEPLRGRLFGAGADSNSAIAIVSLGAAQRLWPGVDPLGRVLHLDETSIDSANAGIPRAVEVVAIVPDIASGFIIHGREQPTVYLPARLGDAQLDTLLLRLSDSSPKALSQLYQHCVRLGDDAGCQPLQLTEALRLQQIPVRLAGLLTAILGWIALAISCIGLHGLVSYTVVQRRREIGIQLALGATASRVVHSVMRSALRQIAVGLALGLPLAWLLARFIASRTDVIGVLDARSFILTPLLLVLIAIAAAWWPARHSARIAPCEVLREDH